MNGTKARTLTVVQVGRILSALGFLPCPDRGVFAASGGRVRVNLPHADPADVDWVTEQLRDHGFKVRAHGATSFVVSG